MDKERKAKVQAIENFLSTYLHESPLKAEYTGIFWNLKEMASKILSEVEQVEVEFLNAHMESNEASRD